KYISQRPSGDTDPPMSRVGPTTSGVIAPVPSALNSETFCAVPGSSCVTTIHLPSGDQALGFLNSVGDRKMGSSGTASPTALTKKSAGPSRSDVNMIFDPSG